jgi:dihydroneopterin triphosphate diphosphatase
MRNKVEAIIFRKNKANIEFLMLRRTKMRGGFWQPVTGGIEQGENEKEAVMREIMEETGIKKIIRIIERVYHYHLEGDDADEYVFGVEISPDAEIFLDKNIYPEHDEYKWCKFEKALSLLKWPGNKEGLKKLNKILTK